MKIVRLLLVGFAPPLVILLVIGAAVLAAPVAPAGAQSPPAVGDFDALAADLVRFHELGLLKGGSGQPVTFDEQAARDRGFSAAAVRLGRQVADHSNEIVASLARAQQASGTEPPAFDTQRYPELHAFQSQATVRRRALEAAGAAGASEAATPEVTPGQVAPQGIPGLSHKVCGYYPNPKPGSAAPWREHSSSDPAATLRGWGYHSTPGLVGGGWTRPQTYQAFLCGVSTYRDHALITGRTSLREQNYTGSPGGEPNPEVYRSGPWPYPDWPAYVYWWHRTR